MSPNVDWTTMPSIVSHKVTGNASTVTITVKLPKRESGSLGYYLRTDVIGSDNEIVENLLFIDVSKLSKVGITSVTSTLVKLNSVTASNYNATSSTLDLTFNYSGHVYWYLRVEAMNHLM